MDADALRALAVRVGALGDQVRGCAAAATGAAVPGWRSAAASAWRDRVAAESAALLRLSAAIDDAAAELARHAARCS